LSQIEKHRETSHRPPVLDVHLIPGNLSTLKAPKVRDWPLRHPRFRPARPSAAELAAGIQARNDDPKPFTRHKTTDEIPDTLAANHTATNK
jgi:hypothetical protein